MNNQEAITLLRNLEDSLNSYCGLNEEGKTAFRMAIEALGCSEIPNNSDTISRQAVKDIFTELYGISPIGSVFDKYEWADICETTANELPSAQPERKAVFNRDIAIEAICDELMLWFDISATKAYEIADTAVKRIEVRMEKMNRGEKDERFNQ